MYKRIVIDRTENNIAICECEKEDGSIEKTTIPFSDIEGEIKEGFEIYKDGDKYKTKRNESKEKEMKRRLNNLFERTKRKKTE